MSATDVSVNLLLVRGSGSNMQYLVQGREVDKSHLLPQKADLFSPGKYCFYWPGAVALFGGHMEEGETPVQALQREIGEEELPNLDPTIFGRLDHRVYNWKTDVPRVLAEAEDVFQGNVNCFFGCDLNAPVPTAALGKDRGLEEITYMDWMLQRESDHYFALNIGNLTAGEGLKDREGLGAYWVPHWLARSIATVPIDKIAILDDMVQRVRSGELEIKAQS